MSASSKIVNGFKFMPPALGAWIGKDIPKEEFSGDIPWSPLKKPLSQTRFSLMTSAGISMKSDPPFDLEREKQEPEWGDPGHREIPRSATEDQIEVSHLHINTDYIRQDLNVMMPIGLFSRLEAEGVIGSLAPTCFSYYGFQPDPSELLEKTMPKVAAKMKEEEIEAAFLTPA